LNQTSNLSSNESSVLPLEVLNQTSNLSSNESSIVSSEGLSPNSNLSSNESSVLPLEALNPNGDIASPPEHSLSSTESSIVSSEALSPNSENALPSKHSSSNNQLSITDPMISIPPSKMNVHYHEMWNHSTSTIDIPDVYKNPFNLTFMNKKGEPIHTLTSLEILQKVLHGREYGEVFAEVEDYMEALKANSTEEPLAVPSCLAPDLKATRKLADRIVKVRNRKKKSKDNSAWAMSLPVLNVGFPKVGSNTLNDYFNCIGLNSRHQQNGKEMFQKLSRGEGIYGSKKPKGFSRIKAFTQLDFNVEIGYYPQVSLLDELHEEHPDSTFVLNFRPIADWIYSTKEWYGMALRFAEFSMPGLILTPKQLERHKKIRAFKRSKEIQANRTIPVGEAKRKLKPRVIPLTDTQLAKWWCGHVLHLREYVEEYPSHDLIELDLYDNDGTEALLYDLFQADRRNYGESDDDADETTTLPHNKRKKCWEKKNTLEEMKRKRSEEKAQPKFDVEQMKTDEK